MAKITRDSLMTPEAYTKIRQTFRTQVIEHKKCRRISLGPNITLIFEDELTIRYQIQEMLHAEKISDEEAILYELSIYTPLIPDGSNWKATMMIEYPDPVERVAKLATLIGIEDKVWIKVAGHASIYAIANEDMERRITGKTSSVHFLRFELTAPMIQALHQGATLSMGVEHPAYQVSIDVVDTNQRKSLLSNLIL